MKILQLFVLTALIFVASCSHVRTTKNYNDMTIADNEAKAKASIVASNYGLYLFGLIPIVTGNSLGSTFSLFSDKVTVGNAFQALVKEAESRGVKKTLNVSSSLSYTTVPFTYGILWVREVQVSGNAIE